MATKFSDISKGPNDLLNDDYTSKYVLKAKKGAGPVTFTIETEQDKSGALSSKIGTKYSYAKFSLDKGQVKGDGSRIVETSYKLSPELKLSFKGGKGADVCVDYTKGSLAATGVVDVMEMSKISSSVCMGMAGGFKVGADATYSLSGSTGLSAFSAGASYSTGPFFASMTATSKSTINLGLLYKVNADLTLASSTTHASDKLCTVHGVGAALKLPQVGVIKAKYDGNHVVSACVTREVVPKVTLTASGAMSISDPATFKPGFTLTI